MGGEVRFREPDARRPSVVVDSEIGQPAVLGSTRLMGDELAGEVAVAARSRHVVHPVLGKQDITHEEAYALGRTGDAAQEHGAVLVVVTGEMVPGETSPVGLGGTKFDGHRVLSQWSTFWIFWRGVCAEGSPPSGARAASQGGASLPLAIEES